MANVKGKPTWIKIGNITMKRKNLCGWMREEPASLKLFFTFQDYGIHNEWIERPKEELDEIEEKLNKLKDSNCL